MKYAVCIMNAMVHGVDTRVWLYEGDNPWHFITIKKTDADEIKKEYIWPRRGFGAIPVYVTVGKTRWKTSIFPEKGGAYVLPIKKSVRVAEAIHAGDTISLRIEVVQ